MNSTDVPKYSMTYFPRKHLLVLALLLSLLFISIYFTPANPDRVSERLPIALTSLETPKDGKTSPEISPTWVWKEEKVKSGDNLSLIFQRVGVSASTLHNIMTSSHRAEQLKKIHPGHVLKFAFDQDNQLKALTYTPSRLEQLEILRDDDNSFIVEHIIKQADIAIGYRHATLKDSLFLAGSKAGISQGMIMQVANVFGGVIDFVYDPRSGDSFDVLYEEQYIDGEKIGNGNLLAASYTNNGETYTAYRYEFQDGSSGYFNADGISMRKPFLRSPLDFTRISSGFNLKRRHPIHKKVKAHRGIDYAAPRGTPIFSAGDGRVTKAGYSKANGNYVFIQHGPTYMTKYLHLHKRHVKRGQKVKQRAVIGTVGSTGYATGPHLHYEFLVNGVHRNPRTIFSKLPSAKPIPSEDKQHFEEQISFLQRQYHAHKLAKLDQ